MNPKNTNQNNNQNRPPNRQKPSKGSPAGGPKKASRGRAIRAQKQALEDANRIANQYLDASASPQPKAGAKPRANFIDDSPRLKVIGLGGMDGGGSKNMMVIEYQNDAVVIDCGSDLGIDLPGINYGIADTTYLDQIKGKIKG